MGLRGDDSTAARAVLVLLAALIAVELYGFFSVRPWTQPIWYPVGMERFGFFTGLFVGVATPLAILVPWAIGPLAVTLTTAGTVYAVGWAAVLAPVLFLLSAWSLGTLVLRPQERSLETGLLAAILGIGVYVCLMTVTARLPVHYAVVWMALLLAPVVALVSSPRRFASSLQPLPYGRGSGRSDCDNPTLSRDRQGAGLRGIGNAPHHWSFSDYLGLTLLCFVLLMYWLVVLKPEAGADGLSVHLAVPAHIAAHHAYTIDPARLVWAVMPLGADWTYAIVYLMGGEFAARLLNFGYFLLLLALLYAVMRRWLARAPALLLLAVFAATPVAQLVTGELFVENLQALLLLGMVVSLAGSAFSPAKSLHLAAVLGGAALATKVGSVAFLAAAIPVAMIGSRRKPRPTAATWAAAALLLLATAAPTYLIAWRLTGNPLFPYFNQTFHSALLPPSVNVNDFRFRQPLRWSTLFDLTFHTHRYYEGQDGSLGFQFLLLAPLALLLAPAARRVRPFLAVGLAGMALVLLSTPNARYLYAALPLLMAAAAGALGWLAERQRRNYRAALIAMVVCAAANIYFLPSASWYHKGFYLPQPLSPGARQAHISMVSPVRDVAIHFRQRHPGENVLLTGDNAQADLAGDAHELGWHEPRLFDAAFHTLDMPSMARLMEQWRIWYVIAPVQRDGNWLRPPAMRELLTWCGQSEYQFDTFYVAHLDPHCLDHPPPERPLVTVAAGAYDDFDPALRYRGDWEHSTDFDGPSQHSISYSGLTGAEVALAFQGRALTYVFTKAPNRGIAEIRIDGAPGAMLDLYSPRIEWQTRYRICCLNPGHHEAAIRVTGRKQAASQGQFVDVDTLVVE